MGYVKVRTAVTSKGFGIFDSLSDKYYTYSVLKINTGTNPMSRLEVVSLLNSFNITTSMFFYGYNNRTAKYNPKVYLSAVQSVAPGWNYDYQIGQQNGLANIDETDQKSGSWPYNPA
ncbi:MAG TPA: hypothetical protein DCY93_04070 [Firmicutes bacterium]|nr:hypothetical protein [Bacillota bacterium]